MDLPALAEQGGTRAACAVHTPLQQPVLGCDDEFPGDIRKGNLESSDPLAVAVSQTEVEEGIGCAAVRKRTRKPEESVPLPPLHAQRELVLN